MMKLLRIILFPIVPVYFVVTWLRNVLYDKGIKTSKSYDFPVICVGNLSTGGTGKTPMIEYLIRELASKKRLATLSRGYKRKTNGFVVADHMATVATLGDEPLQLFKKFKFLTVAVDEDRQHGISELRQQQPQPEVILLDDAFQHRKVTPGFTILLTAYSNVYTNDMVLPTGNLREPKSGAKRADVIVVTKCPNDISEKEKTNIITLLRPQKHQTVFFSSIYYTYKVISSETHKTLTELNTFTLVTGIANARPIVAFLKSKHLNFKHLEYKDHHNYTLKDVEKLNQLDCILTTEKDYVRLYEFEVLRPKLYYIPIKIVIDNDKAFRKLLQTYISKYN